MATLVLPADLAPSLRERAEQLVAECGLARHPAPRSVPRERERCHRCRELGGRMGGHHLPDGTVVRIHPSCHRKLHRAGRT